MDYRKRDQRQIEAAVANAADHLLGGCHRDVQLDLRKLTAQKPERRAKTVDQRGGSGGEVKGTRIPGGIVDEFLAYLFHTSDDRAGMLSQAQGGWCGNQSLARAHE